MTESAVEAFQPDEYAMIKIDEFREFTLYLENFPQCQCWLREKRSKH